MDKAEFQAIHNEIWRIIYERQLPSYKHHTADPSNSSMSDNNNNAEKIV